jgi:CRISPR type IV-associated protein Csf3
MPVVVILADRLEWYCVGDIDGIRDLLNGVLAIGKKRSQGYGMVEEWIVEEWPEDWSEVGPDGKLMRAVHELPENVSGARMMMWGVRPPYWFRENQKVMCLP